MRTYRKYGVIGVYSEPHPHWGPQGLTLYMNAKLAWNPDLNVEEELDLYYKNYYGPAAEQMKSYHEFLEDASGGEVYHGSGGSEIERIFTDRIIMQMGKYMQEAGKLVYGKEPYARRMEGVRAGYEYARRWRKVNRLKEELRYEQALSEIDEIEKFVYSYSQGDVFDNGKNESFIPSKLNNARTKIQEQMQLLKLFRNPEVLNDITKQWRFKTDPKDKGISSGWLKPELDDSQWPVINADLWWQEQGYAGYHGTAWYRRQFKIPANDSKRIFILFGAVDGDATVYINQEESGRHILGRDGHGWDKPFYFDITESIKNSTNLVAVKVNKETAMSGIFKGVKIICTD